MARPLILMMLPALLIAAACGSGDGNDPAPPATVPATVAGAGTPGATATGSAAGAPAAGAYRAERAFSQLSYERMVGLQWVPGAPDEAVVLTQHEGIVYRVNLADDEAEPRPYLDVSDKLIDGPRNEQGLLGFAFAPDFATSGEVYVQYSAGNPRRNVLERYRETDGRIDLASAELILEVGQPYSNHNGGATVFGPDGMLYLALGDGGLGGDPQGNGQNPEMLLGSILRIDVSGDGPGYVSPPDNPFASGGGAPEVWAYGFRNPWRITFDRATGDLWAGDVGQSRFEEVDRIVRGGNYGWNITEGPECFAPEENCDRTGLTAPRAWYGRDDGISVTGGYVYRGAAMPELAGWYIYGDFGSGKVWAVDATKDEGDPVLLAETDVPTASFAEDPAGEIYIIGFDEAIYRLTR